MNILVDLSNVPPIPIPLGKDEQNAFYTVIFDARAWGADFPGATYTVLYQRPTGDIYPVLVNQPGPLISWTPSSADTTIVPNAPAYARAEIRLMQGDALGKSATAVFGLTAGILSEAPAAPTPDWVTTVAQDAAKAEAAVAHYPHLTDGDLWIWNPTSEQWEKLIISEGGNPNAVLFTEQTLSDEQKAQARTNVGAGTYSKPGGGIPASDLASDVIPSVPQMATQPDMTDWSQGKTVDAAVLKVDFMAALEDLRDVEAQLEDKADTSDVQEAIESALASTKTYFVRGIASAASLLTSSGTAVSYADLVNAQKGNNNVEIKAAMFDLDYSAQFKISEFLFDSQAGKATVVLTDVTATKVVVATLTGTGETGALTGTVTTTPIGAELPTVTASDNGKFLRVVSGAWAAQTVPSAESNSFGGGS